MKKTSRNNLLFKFAESSVISESKSFTGVAYSGGLISDHGYWGNVVFDLSTTTAEQKTGVLLDHRTDKRIGFTDSVTIAPDGVKVSGKFLSNDDAATVIRDATDGYPWQMSVYIKPASIEECRIDTTVNGTLYPASIERPLIVFRNNTIREVSFVALGADSRTSAQLFADETEFQYELLGGENTMTLEEMKAERDKLQAELDAMKGQFAAQATELQKAQNALAETKFAARKSEAVKLLADIGKPADDAEVLKFAQMPDETFAFVADTLRKTAKVADNQHLMSDYQFADGNGSQSELGAFEAQFNKMYGGAK